MRHRGSLAKALAVLAMLAGGPAWAADSAVVFSFHRFGDDRFPAANTPLEQLDAQIVALKTGGYTVLPLPVVVDALLTGKPLPERAVALSVDEAGRGLWEEAWPRFKAAGLPITVFAASDELDRDNPEAMTWEQLRAMAATGMVTIASQGASRQHLPTVAKADLAAELARSQGRFAAELGKAPDLFAWPYGEMSRDAAEVVRGAGFKAAFGLHSGPAWRGADRWFLPRFALNETYGEAERFRLAARSLPVPAVDITPDDPMLAANPPVFGFTLADEIPGLENLACYTSHSGRALLERLGPRVEVRVSKPLPKGRTRLNCTAPSLDGRWRWFGWQFYVN